MYVIFTVHWGLFTCKIGAPCQEWQKMETTGEWQETKETGYRNRETKEAKNRQMNKKIEGTQERNPPANLTEVSLVREG